MRAYWKDIASKIVKTKKRFFSILVITALGVTMFAGLSAGCQDLRQAGDDLFDEQNLYDIIIQSTLALTADDVRFLEQTEGVDHAEGAYSETVLTNTDGIDERAEVKVLRENGLTQPKLLEGTLPESKNEIAVTEKYCKKSGKGIGDTLILEPEDTDDGEESTESTSEDSEWDVEIEEEEPQGLNTFTYKITAVVLDPTDIVANEGAAAYRSSSSTEYTFFVNKAAVDGDLYTAVYLTVSGARDLLCYSEGYKECVRQVSNRIKDEIKSQREQARYDEVTAEAFAKIDDAESKLEEKFRDAEEKIADAEKEIADGKIELSDGREELKSGQQELGEKEKEAKQQIADAKKEISDGYKQLESAEKKLAKSEKQIAEGEKQLTEGKKELKQQKKSAYKKLNEAESQISSGMQQASAGKQQLEEQVETLKSSMDEAWPQQAWETYVSESAASGDDNQEAKESFLTVFRAVTEGMSAQIDQAIAFLDPSSPGYEQQIAELNAQKTQLSQLPDQAAILGQELGKVNATLQMLETQSGSLNQQKAEAESEFSKAEKTLAANEKELKQGKKELEDGKQKLEESRKELERGEKELEEQEQQANRQIAEAKQKLEDAKMELADGEKELAEGEKELAENVKKLADGRKEAADQLSDARQEVEDIDMTKWYVQDRSALGSYSTIESDADSIEAIGTVFPILFLSVAILISLTTITRMVEDERGLIGTYKALGYRDFAVYGKFLLYACIASLLGGFLGIFCGFVAMPKFFFYVFDAMYILPSYPILFQPVLGICGVLLFEIGVSGAAFFVCHSELRQMPAELMRPKAPHAGSRVFLERIPFIWKKMTFLNKVTMRNLFRYKKRLFMTVGGIMGCTALVLVGLAIKDSVTELMPNQYDHIYRYDLMAVTMDEDNDAFVQQCENDAVIEDYLNLRVESVQASVAGQNGEESVQLMVIPEGKSIEDYILLESTDGTILELPQDGVLVTQNMSTVLNFETGDMIQIQDTELKQEGASVSGIVKNYLGNPVYMTQSYYEHLFDTCEPNAILAHLSESCADHTAYADQMARESDVISAVSTQSMRDEFAKSFSLINSVVVLVTFLAAVLAFVVLFTLSTTNISERERELATIKVLGFFDREVHQYINKETLILSLMGIALGLPVGRFFSGLLTTVLKLPAVHFAVYVYPVSFLIAAAITFVFALIVNLITNRSLDGINMVDALKSVE